MRSGTEILRESVDWHTMADTISCDSGLFDNLEKFGEVIVAGGYKYDLMMYGDIDIHLLCKPTKSLAASIVSYFIDDGWWRSVKCVDNYRHTGSGRTNWLKCYYIGLSKWVDDHK
jgi:hypothetical protein